MSDWTGAHKPAAAAHVHLLLVSVNWTVVGGDLGLHRCAMVGGGTDWCGALAGSRICGRGRLGAKHIQKSSPFPSGNLRFAVLATKPGEKIGLAGTPAGVHSRREHGSTILSRENRHPSL